MNSSKWKHPFQKKKRERQQPSSRAHLGFLEKKKDYVIRAKYQHEKDDFIHQMRREASQRNPDEFYFSMITDTKKKKIETKSKPLSHFNKEQRLLLETRDQNYIQMKLHIHRKKLDELMQRLPKPKKKSTRIFMTIEEALAAKAQEEQEESESITPEIKELQAEIAQRQKIVDQLQEVFDEMQLQKDLKDGEAIRYEDDEGNVSFQWKKERKH